MRIISSLFFALFAFSVSFAEGIEFRDVQNWDQAVKLAKKENKPIFLDGYTTWCGPCKMMAKNVFTQEKVGVFFNENFVNVKFDLETEAGKPIAKEHEIYAFPTMIFFDHNGEFTHRSVGYHEADELIELGREALNPSMQIARKIRKFEGGERAEEFLFDLAFSLYHAGMDYDEVVPAYLSTQNAKSLATEENWEFVKAFIQDVFSKDFEEIMQHEKQFRMIAGNDEFELYLKYAFYHAMGNIASKGDESRLYALKKQMKTYAGEKYPAYSARADYYFHSENETLSHKYASIYFNEYCDSWQELNGVAWQYFEDEDDQVKIKAAAQWAERSIAIDENFYNLDTYASLLYKAKAYKSAKNVAENAIEMGKKAEEDVSMTVELLDRIKADMAK